MRSRQIRLIGIILVATLLVLGQFPFFAPVHDQTRLVLGAPIRFFDTVGGKLIGAFKVVFSINELSRENAALKSDKTVLEARVAALEAVKTENETLRRDLNFKQVHPELQLMPAAVLSFSPSGLYQALTINLGSDDGIRVGQAVVSGGYLIGKVRDIAPQTAEIYLLANRNLLTPVTLTGSRTVGLLFGGIRGLVVENIPLDTPVSVGEAVVTSSLEGLYPAGIAVGKVAEIISPKEEIFLTLRVNSPVSLSDLTTVFVVR